MERNDRRVDVLGVLVDAVTMDDAVQRISRWIDDGDPAYVCVTGAHGIIEARGDEELRRIHNDAALVTPDGMPLVWACRHAGVDEVERVYGPDLVLALAERGAERGWSAFYYGGGEGIADALAATLERRFEGFETVGTHTPPFRPLADDELDAVAATINQAGPDIVFVGLSTPKQERWMATMRSRLEAPVLIGVGAAFDFHTGNARQAPPWMQRRGLEWLFRMLTEPRRLARRYAKVVPTFMLGVLRKRPAVAQAAPRTRT